MDLKLKHLEFIQSVISRMASNSFLLKGWCVTLVAALFALAAKDSNPRFISVAYYPILIFWLLDGYFLTQERCFRGLYNKVRQLPPEAIDFSMDAREFNKGRNTWSFALLSTTLALFYLPPILVVLLVPRFLLR